MQKLVGCPPHAPGRAWLPLESGAGRRYRVLPLGDGGLLTAAIGWLCLADELAPQDLHEAMDVLPWMDAAGVS